MPAIGSEVVLLESAAALAQLLSVCSAPTSPKPGRPGPQAWLATPKATLPAPPRASRPHDAQLPLPFPRRFAPAYLLSSAEDLLCAAAHFADSGNLHSPRAPARPPACTGGSTGQPPQPSSVVPVAASALPPQQTVAGDTARNSDPDTLPPEDFLASAEDLFRVLARLAGSRNSSQNRRDHRLAQAAVSNLLPNVPVTWQPRPVVPVATPAPAQQQTVAGNAARTSDRRISGGAGYGPSRVPRRQFCKCGECKWCLDNVRWDRIFNEKFADPAYYGQLILGHNSCLAGAR